MRFLLDTLGYSCSFKLRLCPVLHLKMKLVVSKSNFFIFFLFPLCYFCACSKFRLFPFFSFILISLPGQLQSDATRVQIVCISLTWWMCLHHPIISTVRVSQWLLRQWCKVMASISCLTSFQSGFSVPTLWEWSAIHLGVYNYCNLPFSPLQCEKQLC